MATKIPTDRLKEKAEKIMAELKKREDEERALAKKNVETRLIKIGASVEKHWNGGAAIDPNIVDDILIEIGGNVATINLIKTRIVSEKEVLI